MTIPSLKIPGWKEREDQSTGWVSGIAWPRECPGTTASTLRDLSSYDKPWGSSAAYLQDHQHANGGGSVALHVQVDSPSSSGMATSTPWLSSHRITRLDGRVAYLQVFTYGGTVHFGLQVIMPWRIWIPAMREFLESWFIGRSLQAAHQSMTAKTGVVVYTASISAATTKATSILRAGI